VLGANYRVQATARLLKGLGILMRRLLCVVTIICACLVGLSEAPTASAYTYKLCGSKQTNVAQGNSLYADASTRRYSSFWFTQYITGTVYNIRLTIWQGSPLTVWKQFGNTNGNASAYDDGGTNFLRAVSGTNVSGHGTLNMFVSYEANTAGNKPCKTA
jgi:hypothetical protein